MVKEKRTTVKKTLELSEELDKCVKISASLKGLSDAEYIRQILEKEITDEIRELVKKNDFKK